VLPRSLILHWNQAEGATIGSPLVAVAEVKNTGLLIAVGRGGVILRSPSCSTTSLNDIIPRCRLAHAYPVTRIDIKPLKIRQDMRWRSYFFAN
jgi:hypothetical protein